MSFQDNISDFIDELLDGYEPPKIRDKKAIHELVSGTNVFERHEVVLLDTPL